MPTNKTKKAPTKRATTNRGGASVGGVKAKSKNRSALFSFVVVLVLVGLGYVGYYGWQRYSQNKLNNGLKAHAANYGAVIKNDVNLTARACQKRYSTNRSDEVWVIVSRKPRTITYNMYIKNFLAVSIPGQRAVEQSSDGWWGNLQLFKIPVGRANINNGAYLSGAPSYHRGQKNSDLRVSSTTGGNGIIYLSVGGVGVETLTGSYTGARTAAKTSQGTFRLPLVRGLPICDY